ncbi:uncharacterized protein LOC144626511 [Crassostrea virginica]
MLYMTHPHGKVMAPLNERSEIVDDPYNAGIDMLDFSDEHIRTKRSSPNQRFKIHATNVDWRKMIGSPDVGASFGVVLKNTLDLKIAPLSSEMMVEVHDESYARLHLGNMGENMDYFDARICFKGGSKYNINILKANEMRNIDHLAESYDREVAAVASSLTTGVNRFIDVIAGNYSMKTTIGQLVEATNVLTDKVSSLMNATTAAMMKIGQYEPKNLPSGFTPTLHFIHRITRTLNDIRYHIIGFRNEVEETVQLILPQQAKFLYDALLDVLDGLTHIPKDPKTAIMSIGNGVVTIGNAVEKLKVAIEMLQETCWFERKEKPYWFDLSDVLSEFQDLMSVANSTLMAAGSEWMNETLQEDQIQTFSRANENTDSVKQEVINSFTSVTKDLMSTLEALDGVGDSFLYRYFQVFRMVKKAKESNNVLKTGYETARAKVESIFGPRTHRDFPGQIRLSGQGCSGNGLYPSSLEKSGVDEYNHTGLDLSISNGENVVAPFPGSVSLESVGGNTVVLVPSEGSLKDIVIYISNIEPNSTISVDDNRAVIGGQVIGIANSSHCEEHIHLSFKKVGASYVDPTRFLEKAYPTLPAWVQQCDDYKLVFKTDTVAAGVIVGVSGQSVKDKDPVLDNVANITFPTAPPTSYDPDDSQSIKMDPDSFYTVVKNKVEVVGYNIDSGADSDATSSSESSTGMFSTLLLKADTFLQKYNLRRLKFGTIIEFLDKFNMTTSKEALRDVLKSIKDIINYNPCLSPNEMTEDQLIMELIQQGKNTSGSREVLASRLMDQYLECPLMSFTMPKNVYCTFEKNCLGVECCVGLELSFLTKTYKIWVNIDPCSSPIKLSMGVGMNSYQFELQSNGSDSVEGEIIVNSTSDTSLGGISVMLKYSVFKGDNASLMTIGAGLCSKSDPDYCPSFVTLLDNAILRIPKCLSDGSFEWPTVNYQLLLRRQASWRKIKQSGKSLAKKTITDIDEAYLQELGLTKSMIDESGPCPRPEILTEGQIKLALEDRNLSSNGTRSELNSRLTQYNHGNCCQFSDLYEMSMLVAEESQ